MEETGIGVKKTIMDEIGEDYKKWHPGQKILISAPTGSGKTYFILHKLLDYAWENNKRIVYFVNRKILKQQLEEELDRLDKSKYITSFHPNNKNIFTFLEIWTYQSLEAIIRENTYNSGAYTQRLFWFDYLVCDECHYFYCDSNFNTATMLSFSFLVNMFMQKISIFMSATMESIQPYILNNTVINRTHEYFRNWQEGTEDKILQSDEVITYSLKQDYSYLSIELFGRKEDISELPDKYDGKWLIFVDNIEYGRDLCRELIKKYKDKDKEIVFVDAEYEKSEESIRTVKSLAEQKFAKEDILIATSVLDNGVSIHDFGLRNIVILTDNYETFIQMIGRKREDEEKVNLFIPFQNKQFFQRRLNTVICPAIKFVDEFYRKYCFSMNVNQMGYITVQYCCQGPAMMKLFDDIMDNPRVLESVRKLCCISYPIQGVLLNDFSVKRMYDLQKHYQRIIDRFDTDEESAFVRVQLEWLGISEKEADGIIRDYMIGKENRERQSLITIIEYVCGKEFTKEDNEKFRADILESVRFLSKNISCESSEEEKELKNKLDNLGKKDRPISDKAFNYFMGKIGLPYEMTKSGKNYFIKHLEN